MVDGRRSDRRMRRTGLAEAKPAGPSGSEIAAMNPPSANAAPRAVFLDRDGTLIEDRHYLGDPDGVIVLPGVREALARLRERNVKLFLFTNQSGVGRGYFTLADVARVNARMVEAIGLGDDLFTAICVATERPDEPIEYRKPSPRFILEMLTAHAIAADEAWMIGDTPRDWEAGANAGVHVAAIIGRMGTASARRQGRGVPGYLSLAEWVRDVCP